MKFNTEKVSMAKRMCSAKFDKELPISFLCAVRCRPWDSSFHGLTQPKFSSREKFVGMGGVTRLP